MIAVLLSISPSPRRPNSFESTVLRLSGWLLCLFGIDCGRDGLPAMNVFVFLLLSRLLIVDCIAFYCAPYNPAYIRLIVVLIRHVICASHASALPSGGDYLLRAIVRSHVQGLCVGCTKDTAQLTAPTPLPVAQTFKRVMVALGGDWLALR